MAENVVNTVAVAVERALDVIEQVVLFIGNVVRSIVDLIARLGVCVAGQTIYLLAKADLVFWNAGFAILGASVRPLSSEFQSKLTSLFGSTSFDTVMYQELAHLPQEYWFSDDTDAMTFAGIELAGVTLDYMIYAKSFVTRFADDLRLLVHELVHVTQYYRTGSEMAFACTYGIGYEQGGSYKANPLEDQAYDFVDAHYWDIDAWDISGDP